jgi:microsomal dipeptidase-like Zn-dependent dipeptidase
MRPVFDGHNDALTCEDHALIVDGRPAGFSDSELDAIAWDNWRRVLAAWWGG